MSKAIKSIDDPRYVKAMSHPMRVRILAMLDERTASPNKLAGWLDATLGTVSYHVRTLEQLGLIELVNETQVRGAIEHHYRAKTRPTVTSEQWADASPIVKQSTIASTLQVLSAYAQTAAGAGGFDHNNSQVCRVLIKLDARGFEQLSRACEKLMTQAERIEASAAERLTRKSDTQIAEVGLGVLLFEATRLSSVSNGKPSSK